MNDDEGSLFTEAVAPGGLDLDGAGKPSLFDFSQERFVHADRTACTASGIGTDGDDAASLGAPPEYLSLVSTQSREGA